MRSTMQKPEESMHSMSVEFCLLIRHLSKLYYTNIWPQVHSNDDNFRGTTMSYNK